MWLEARACLFGALFTFAACGGSQVSPGRPVTLKRSPRAVCSSSLIITPAEDDLYWHVGEVQEVWCSLVETNNNNNNYYNYNNYRNNHNYHYSPFSSSLTVQDLTFLKNMQRLNHQIVNQTSILVTLNLTEAETFKLTCTDYNGNTCMTQVIVGYEPLPVQDLRCVSHNWEVFWCNWTIPYNPAQVTANDYQTYLVPASDTSRRYECGCGDYANLLGEECQCPNTCCIWSGESYFSTERQVVVLFVAQNELGSFNFTYAIDTYAVVLPEALSAVSVEEAGSGSGSGRREAVVRWTLPAPMGTFAAEGGGVVVQVDHRLAHGDHNDAPWTKGKPLPCHASTCKHGTHTISLEYWWQVFEVRARLRSAAAPPKDEEEEAKEEVEDGWWSSWEPQHYQTPPAAPDAPPAVGSGSFQVTDKGLPGLYDLTLAWQEVPAVLHNGSAFAYLTQACAAPAGTEAQVVAEVAAQDTFAVFHNLSTSLPYTLRLAANNSEGRGPWVEVRVEPDRPTPPLLPVVVVHARPGQEAPLYELWWQPGDAPHCTVYLCVGKQEGSNPCTGQLSWTSVGNVTAANLTLQDFGVEGAVPQQMTFAVSQEDAAGASSGLSWARCVSPQPYSAARVPPEPADTHDVRTGSSWVEVPWSLECQYWAGVVEGVEATYCRGTHLLPHNCTGNEMNVTADAWTSSLLLTELKEGVQYTAWLRLKYRSGFSQWSKGVTFTTNDPGVEVWVIAVVVGVAAVITVGLVMGFLYSKRKFVDNLKKFRLKPSLPSGLVPTSRQQQQQQQGSGRGVGGREGVIGDMPVSRNTVSASVRNPGYSHILPRDFGRRPSLTLEEEEAERDRNSNIGRGLAQGGRRMSPSQRHRQTDDNIPYTAPERFNTDEGDEEGNSSSSSGSTREPLLRGASTTDHYVTPYFSESDSEVAKDTNPTDPLFSKGYVSLSTGISDERSLTNPSEARSSPNGGGGSGGYVLPSACTKLTEVQASSGYVTVQHGDNIGALNSGYVQADAIPHLLAAPDGGNIRTPPVKSSQYVSLDFPMTRGGPADFQNPPGTPHHSIFQAQDAPTPHHAPGAPTTTITPLHSTLKNELQDTIDKHSYISMPDALLSMKYAGNDHGAKTFDRLNKKESEKNEKAFSPPSDTPAPGYIVVQPPDFGTPAVDVLKEINGDMERKSHHTDFIFSSQRPFTPLISTAFPAITPDAPEVPGNTRKLDNEHIPAATKDTPYIPFSLRSADKNDDNSIFSTVMPSARTFNNATFSHAPATGISFVMLTHQQSKGDESEELDIIESDVTIETEERGEVEAGEDEVMEEENSDIDDLPKGYSRVGEPPH